MVVFTQKLLKLFSWWQSISWNLYSSNYTTCLPLLWIN